MPSRREVLVVGSLASLRAVSQTRPPRSASRPAPARAGRERLYALLGDLPDRHRPIGSKKRSEQERDGYVLETWDLDLNGIENVPAFFARPRTLTGRAPAVLFNHSHGGGYQIGKTEFIEGREYLGKPPYAEFLTSLGYTHPRGCQPTDQPARMLEPVRRGR